VLKKHKLQKQTDSIEFITKAVVQDWSEFKNIIKNEPSISPEDRSAIIKIVDGAGSFIDKERQLKQLPVYKTLLTKVYPTLRRAKTEILTLKPKKSDATISILAKEITKNALPADTLKEAELMFAATLTPNLDEKEAIYLAATKKHDSQAAHNNLGAVYLEKALKVTGNARKDVVAKAITHLEIAKSKQENAEINANLGAAYLMIGQLDKAITALDAAAKFSPATEVDKRIKAMRGVTYIRKGDYNSANANLVNAFNEDAMVTYNRALAQLLVKDYAKAKASIEESIAANSNFAKSYYVAAVIAARQNRTADLAENLRKAIEKDAELRKRAISDIEFIAVFDNPVFKSAIK
jgi:tetratricopeptide (TPR) repeat protein